jgi:hypothetical protein
MSCEPWARYQQKFKGISLLAACYGSALLSGGRCGRCLDWHTCRERHKCLVDPGNYSQWSGCTSPSDLLRERFWRSARALPTGAHMSWARNKHLSQWRPRIPTECPGNWSLYLLASGTCCGALLSEYAGVVRLAPTCHENLKRSNWTCWYGILGQRSSQTSNPAWNCSASFWRSARALLNWP